MKKILSLLTFVAISVSLTANAAESQLQNYVNKKLEPAVKKEQEYKAKQAAQKAANEQKRAQFQKQQDANKAKLEEFLSKLEGKNIKLTSDEFRVIKEYVNKNSNGSTSGNYESFTQKTQSSAVDTFNMKNVITQFSGADKFRGFNSNLAVNNIQRYWRT